MKKNTLIKLSVIVLALSMLLSLFACDDEHETSGESDTEPVENVTETGTDTAEPTESETEPVTEPDTDTETEADTNTETESATESETESETETESGTESESETEEEETDCYHPYDATQEGHWKPACDVCGKGVGKMQDHEYSEYVEDEGDLLYYSYVCDICSFVAYGQEVPYEINLFYPASEIANLDSTGGVEGVYNFVSGIGYASFARDSETAGSSSTIKVEDSGSIEDDPVGQYMAIKLRLPRSQTTVTLNIQSVHSDKAYDLKLSNLKPGWITLVLDLAKIAKTVNGDSGAVTNMGYFADQFDEFYLKSFSLTAYIGAGESLDISYVIFCEEYEDVMTFVESENNYYIYKDAINEEPEKHTVDCKHDYIIDEENGTHTLKDPCFICGTDSVSDEVHTYVEITGNGRNSYECSVCGYAMYYKVVPVEVNKYYSASELNAGGIIYYPYTEFNHGLHVETGDAYTRYDGPTSLTNGNYYKVGQVIFARDDADQNPTYNGDRENGIRINVGDATYFVLRVRVNTDDLNALTVTISTTGHAGYTSGEGNSSFSIPVASTPKDTWNTYVINLADVFPTKYLSDENGDYVVDTFYFNICQGSFLPGVTLDLSYMAYCSTWDEVAGLVDEEQLFYLGDSTGGGNWVNTVTRGCVDAHTPGDANITEKDGETTYEFVCSVCGQPAASKTVDSSVTRYYYPGEISSTAKTYFQLNGAAGGKGGSNVYDEENEIVFSRFTGYKDADAEAGTTPATGQALWQRAQEDMWGGQTSGKNEQYTESVGNAEWLVMRVRSSRAAQKLYFVYSTTAYSAEDGTALGRSNGGMIEVLIPLSAAEEGEWATYVINLKNIDPVAYVKDDMGTPDDTSDDEYIIDSFYLSFSSFPKSESVDIEYMAFVDGSWAELDALVDETSVVVVSDKTGGYGYANVATGKCLEGSHAYGYSSVTDAEGNMTNTIVCAVCGNTLRTQNVSADVNKFFDVTKIGCYYQVNEEDASTNNSDAKMQSATIDVESGERFVRCAATFGNTHINLNGGTGGGVLSTEAISTGRYAVIKLRTSGNRSLTFDAQTGDYPSHTNSMYTADADDADKWMVWVIDLSALKNEEGVKGYTVNSEQTVKFRFTTNGTSRDEDGFYINDPYYVDIAYFAVVDELADAQSMITDNTYVLYSNGLGSAGIAKNTEDGSCVEHVASSESVVENKENDVVISHTYKYVCGGCGTYSVYEKTVPVSLGEYISAKTLSDNVSVSYQITKKGLVIEQGAPFVRFEGQDKENQILWVRSEEDFGASGDAGKGATYDVGNATRLVIKVRSNADLENLSLTISTAGKSGNGEAAYIGEGENKKQNGYTENGYKSVTLQKSETAAHMTAGEWTVYVIDLATVIPDYYKKADGATGYVIDTLYLSSSAMSVAQYLDIAYVAFAETWEEVDVIVDEETATEITSADGTASQTVNVSDGSTVSVEDTDNGEA